MIFGGVSVKSTSKPGRGLRRCAVALAAAAAMIAPLACSSNGSDGDAASGETVSIEHVRGTTEITGTPERVVALGTQWLDTVQSLGVQPVGYLDTIAPLNGGKAAPWEPAELEKSKALSAQGDIVEQVAALNPDLILAPGYGIDEKAYEKLTQLAPTVGALTASSVDPWDQLVTTAGKALGKQDKAKEVVDEVNGKIDALGQRLPGLKGKTFITSMMFSPTQIMALADPKDGSSALFLRLGMVAPQPLVDEAAKSGGRIALSPERVGDLQSDLLIAAAAAGMEEQYKALPGYSTLPAVQKGSVAFVDTATISGINTPTVLAIPYVLEKLEPAFANAAK